MVLDLDVWLPIFVNDLEREVLDIGLHLGIGEPTTNEALDFEDTGDVAVN